MYKLYNVKRWGSMCAHFLLEEMGVPYTNVWMTPEQVRTPEFRDLSPLGYVPALGLADGRALFESTAIVAHLAAAHPDKRMAPAPGTPDFGVFLSWLAFMGTNLYPAVDWSHELAVYIPEPARDSRLAAIGLERFDERMGIVEGRLAEEGPFMMGKEVSALDLYLFMFAIWAVPSEAAMRAKFANVARVADAVRARPKLKAALEAHGVVHVAA